MSFFNQLSLLIWKNYLLRKRHKMRLMIELLCPLVLFLIFMWVRTKGLKFHKPHCHLVEKTMPSVGGFEFLQNFVCTLNNTCHDDIVEDLGPKEWEDALIIKFIHDTGPMIHKLLEEQDGIDSVHAIWRMATNFMKISIGTESEAALGQRGSVLVDELVPEDSRDDFLSNAELYLGLSKSQSEELLKSKIIPSELNNQAVNEFMDDLANNTCGPMTKYKFIQISSQGVFDKICSMSPFKAQILVAMFQNFMNSNDVGTMMQNVLAKEKAESDPVPALPSVSTETMALLLQLGTKFSDFSKAAGEFVTDNSTGVSALTSFLYKGLCGLSVSSNATSFGFDNNEASNRMDSLRDRLRDWRSHSAYIPDPEVDETCNMVFEQLHSRPFTNLLWRQVKPFIRGKILYAPKTNFTDELMQRVNTRFSDLHQLEHAVNLLVTIVHRLRVWYLDNSALLDHVQKLLRQNGTEAVIENLIAKQFKGPVLTNNRDMLKRILNRVKDTDFEYIDRLLEGYDFGAEGHSHILSCVEYNKMQAFDTECDAVEYGMQLLPDNKLWAVVIFEDMPLDGSAPHHVKYKIRMDSDKVDGTRVIRDRLTSKSPRRRPTIDLKYLTNGFIYLQELVEHSFIEVTTGKNISGEVSTILQQFPYPCYIYDQFIRAISRTFPLFMVLSWVYASAMIVKSIVLEKELRLKEVMKVMGLSNTVIWIGWFIDSAVVMTFSTVMLTFILKYGKIIEFSDFSLLLAFMLCFTLATICFSFLMSTFFSRANSAAAAGGILFFISYLPYNFMLLWEERLTWHHLLFSCLISNVAFGFGCTYLARYEEDGIGAQWDRLTLGTVPDDNFNLIYCILMLLFDSVLYLFLAWYIENVFPGENGMPRRWYFLFQRSYWCPVSAASSSFEKQRRRERYNSAVSEALVQEVISTSPTIEVEPTDLTLGVEVVNLSKTYPNGRIALTNFVMNFYEGQITSFLGHNGAGKTTAISILTGLFPPTKGTARIYGEDIRTQMSSIRKDLGICPQYNVLFDRLTVEEHLKFYSGLKGKDKTSREENDKMLQDLGIPHKRHDFPSSLSGGMKRKLSVACAFVGGSKTVFLDEPTSGVDPYSRRSIWELLLKYKAGRTVILTTHFMDEADILGDRIAIISQGRLVASGTSLFLKAHYGLGYSLRLVREEMSAKEEELVLMNNMGPTSAGTMNPDARSTAKSVVLSRHTELCTNFVHFRVPEAVLMDDVGAEIVYLLPYSSLNSFPGLFQDLDQNLGNLRVSSYGISDTTLEDVFLKITAEDLEEARWDDGRRFCNACCCNALIMSRIWKMRKSIKKKKAKVKHQSEVEPPPVIVHSLDAGYISPADHIIPSVQEQMNDNEDGFIPRSPNKLSPPLTPGSPGPNTPNSADTTQSTMVPELADSDADQETDPENNILLASPAPDLNELAITFRSEPPKRSAGNLACLQMRVILRKRFRNSTRNLRALFFEIILPVVFIALALALTLILPPPSNEVPRLVTPWAYPEPNYVFFAEPKPDATNPVPPPLFDQFVDEIVGPEGIGPPCTKDITARFCQHIDTWNQADKDEFFQERQDYNGSVLGECNCDVGSFQCPAKEEQPPPPKFKTPTGDFILDVSKMESVPKWIRQTYSQYEHKRYGGYEMMMRTPVNTSFAEYIFLIDCLTTLTKPHNLTQELLTGKAPRPYFKVWFENRAWLSSIAYLNSMNNALLRQLLDPATVAPDSKGEYGMTLYTHPMNLTKLQQEKESIKTAALGVVHAICVIFALGFVPASFTMYLIEERQSGAKHLHLVSGVKPIVYWVSSFIFDMCKYLIPVFLCVILFFIFSADAYIGKPSVWAFYCLLLLYGWASIPLMYPASYHFSVPSTAFVVLGCMNLFIGVISTVSVFVLEQLGDADLEEIGGILQQVFLIFPQYCLGTGLMKLVRLHIEDTAFSRMSMDDGNFKNRFDWDMLGKPLTFLAIHGFVFFILNLSYEYKQWIFLICCKRRHYKTKWSPKAVDNMHVDQDVKREADRVLNNSCDEDTLVAENLTKVYTGRMMPSVNKISFAVERGECFGLLGVNGAGKTTTFKMLTGDVRITYGNAKIMGYDVEKSLDNARKHFGYCPQEDGLDPLLNTYEQLELYGRLRGMTLFDVQEMAHRLVAALGLRRYADKRCGTYSGGNKRKVSTAVALIGNPDLVFLDEPTSGMDPGARRQLWKVILKIVHSGKSVVLTSHSMEECEALCNRLAIMVNGRFMCLGSLQHLKNRFGNGYMLTVRCGPETRQEFLHNLASDLPSAVLDDTHCSQLKFKIMQQDVKLGEIFSIMYKEKLAGLVEDYSVSQTTLDDIFVKFASKQRDELDNNVHHGHGHGHGKIKGPAAEHEVNT